VKLNTFGYRGNFVFSAPITITNTDENLVALATPYGNTEIIQEALEKMVSEFESQIADPDSTSPYSKLTCLTPTENQLYTSTQFLNDYLYSNYNQNKLDVGCDLCLLYKKNSRIYMSQLGWPSIVLNYKKMNRPISSEYSNFPRDLDKSVYLPNHLLGLDSSVNAKVQSFSVEEDSKLLFIKSNENPVSLLESYPLDLEEIAKFFSTLNKSQGFWLGELSF